MCSQTSLIAHNVRLQEWADMIHECNNRPDDMTVTQWCSEHGISKCNYYYRLAAVRKACLDKLPPEIKQAVALFLPGRTWHAGQYSVLKDIFPYCMTICTGKCINTISYRRMKPRYV